MTPTLYIFDDRRARSWEPFSSTRPVGELLFGAATLRERAESALGLRCGGHLGTSRLEGFDEPGAPPGIRLDSVPVGEPRVLLSSRAALEPGSAVSATGSSTLVLGGKVVGWSLPAGAPNPPPESLRDPREPPVSGVVVELEGDQLDRPWDLMARNSDRLGKDGRAWGPSEPPAGVHVVGDGTVSLHATAIVEAGVVLDTGDGPIRLERDVEVLGPARLAGPLWVAPGSTILGGAVGHASIGPGCKVRGEIDSSVILGYCNKAHEGYLGHALVGRWVNLGAFTTNSDLKNNYGTVRVSTPEGPEDTGLVKVGCFLGDHVKTGIGTLLNTGTVVGPGSNLFGGGMPATRIPPFSWASGDVVTPHRLDRFLETAARAMGRRGVDLSEGVREVLERAWYALHGPREDLDV